MTCSPVPEERQRTSGLAKLDSAITNVPSSPAIPPVGGQPNQAYGEIASLCVTQICQLGKRNGSAACASRSRARHDDASPPSFASFQMPCRRVRFTHPKEQTISSMIRSSGSCHKQTSPSARPKLDLIKLCLQAWRKHGRWSSRQRASRWRSPAKRRRGAAA